MFVGIPDRNGICKCYFLEEGQYQADQFINLVVSFHHTVSSQLLKFVIEKQKYETSLLFPL